MRLISPQHKKQEENSLLFTLDGNRNIKRVVVSSEGSFSDGVKVKYAQNQITSELIPFCELPTKTGEQKLSFEVNTPAAASHIYVSAPDMNPSELEVEIYEEEEINLLEDYPKCIDKDLGENYLISSVTVKLTGTPRCKFLLYTSMEGRDFSFAGVKEVSENLSEKSFALGGKEARIIRLYVEYVSNDSRFELSDIEFVGEKSNTEYRDLPKIEVPDFADSEYNVPVSDADTYSEVYGIIERRLGEEYKSRFSLELAENPRENHAYDYFELSDKDGKIHIKANSGVTLATGLNHYLKYYCKVNISQVGKQVKMPKTNVPLNTVVFKESKTKIRYAYNYCTLSYTMAFWGDAEWRDELDWLALNGVNLVLDITAQEEVWRRFLTEIGYTHAEIKNFTAGPAYYAWMYMANTFKLGGPVHDSWFSERTELARRNHLIMRKLGMTPILQGYSGMVPVDIADHDPDADIIEQGLWCVAVRPYMLRTTAPSYKRYAKLFYKCQREVYGDYSSYYATDPFHEGGNTADMKPAEISEIILETMLEEDKNAVWIIQSWQANPSSELLRGIENVKDGRNHALILDLYAEKDPHYDLGSSENPNHGYSPEFNSTPWLFCMLNNFGGRMGLHGHLDNLVKNVPQALNNTSVNRGIGITPEASENNPLLYDFFFECIWQDNAREPLPVPDIDAWLADYAERRYGKKSGSAEEALLILKDTVYKAEYNMIGQGAPECVLNARPAFDITSASAWGNSHIGYDPEKLKQALSYLAEDYVDLKSSEGYRYDLTAVVLGVLLNEANTEHKKLKRAYREKDASAFAEISKKLISYIDKMECAASANKYHTLGRWTAKAQRLAEGKDDLTKHLYLFNSKCTLTTWAAYNQSEIGCLHDYSNRPWSGLLELYKTRWEIWLSAVEREITTGEVQEDINWFELEWLWSANDKSYTEDEAEIDILSLIKDVI